jgi:lipoprotein-anchoring transpeptidase ErfK/SrfK
MIKDELSRSLMFLFCAAAMLLLAVHLQSTGANFISNEQKSLFPWFFREEKTSLPLPGDGIRLMVDLSDRRVYVYHFKKRIRSYPIAVGQTGWETPTGSFQVLEKQNHPAWLHPITGAVVKPNADNNPLGDRWIGFWSDGKNQIGFHGTPEDDEMGYAVSHGCIRVRNNDIRTLYEFVSVGTPVVVRK